jgi:pimeloyl-ACP methyl ester carboxylesterase
MVLSGSSGGLGHRDIAQQLARDGIPALALAYFGHGDLPPKLARIHLEYFARAAEILHSHFPGVPIVVMGRSRGGELALQLACSFDCFAGVIATSPSSVRWGAVGQRAPAWMLGGKPLEFVRPLDGAPPVAARTEEHEGRTYFSYVDTYLRDLEHNASGDAATIEIEQCAVPVLLISGRDDKLWPSAIFADQIEARARERGFGAELQNVQYDGVGHIVPLPGQSPPLRFWNEALQFGMLYGGSDAVGRAVAPDYWSKVLGFVNRKM